MNDAEYAAYRCRDCACLCEDVDGDWVCDEAGMAIDDIGRDACPEGFRPEMPNFNSAK